MLLFDKIMSDVENTRRPDLIPDHIRNQIDLMRKSVVIEISNVANYYYSVSEQEYWDYSDFPNIAPPFKSFWMEYSMPRLINSLGNVTELNARGVRYGLLFTTELVDDLPESIKAPCVNLYPEAKWMSGVMVFAGNGRSVGSALGASFTIDQSGMIIYKSKHIFIQPPHTPDSLGVSKDDIGELTYSILNPCFLALSFMHCKNVSSISVQPPEKVSKKFERKNGIPLTKYKTLEIEPMKKVLESEGEIKSLGIKNALHICRGHFKDYRESGLFGKNKGLYWWESHIRGSSSSGIVVKDYKVDVPKGSE